MSCQIQHAHAEEYESTLMPYENILFLYRVMQKALEDIKTCPSCCCTVNKSNLVMNANFEFSCNKCMKNDGTIDIISAKDLLHHCDVFTGRRQGLTECPVCMNEISEENLWSTKCGHMYCESCIFQLEKCAVCRNDLINNY